jgi:diguanylate cyclase (GGDEF)-like protein/PAS domain S-box-containing protein
VEVSKNLLKNYICGPECGSFLDSFFSSMKDGFMLDELIHNLDGSIGFKILEINSAFEELFDVTKEDILGNTLSESFPEMNQEWLAIRSQVKLNGTSIQKDIHFKSKDKYLRVNIISPIKDKYITLFNDITELIKADEALKKHLMLFENAKDIIFYLRTDGSIVDANKTAVENYGYTKSELLNMKVQDLRDPSTMKDFKYQMEMSALNGVLFEAIHVRRDGTKFPVEVSSRTLDINGELIRFHIVRDVTERNKAQEKIRYFADYDALTGIYNRGYLMYQLRKTWEQAIIEHSQFAVLLFDVDKFKAVNDMYGHNAGDEVLKEVSIRLKEAVRKSDIIGRLGGDEFLVVQPFIKDKNDPLILAKRILDCVTNPVEWEGNTLDIHISIGISTFPESADNIKGLIHSADSAMYAVKQKGGNAYSY